MIKYINLDAVLNFIPQAILEEESALQLKSWAYRLLKKYKLDWKFTYKAELIELANHKAKLPDEALGYSYIGYAPLEYQTDILSYFELLDYPNILDTTDKRLIISQQIFHTNNNFPYFKPMKYLGNDSLLLNMNMYCRECESGYTIDKGLSCIIADNKEGFIIIVYKTMVKDESGDILIPDDSDLLEAMAMYAMSQHWLNRASRKEPGANDMYIQSLQIATSLFIKARSNEYFRNYNPETLERYLTDRFKMQQLDSISGNNRNR